MHLARGKRPPDAGCVPILRTERSARCGAGGPCATPEPERYLVSRGSKQASGHTMACVGFCVRRAHPRALSETRRGDSTYGMSSP